MYNNVFWISKYTKPNLLHLLQTAEGIRKANHPDWLQLVGLLHDMGKIMFLWGNGADGQDGYSPTGKQWALGGDTFVVGCQIPNEAVILPQFNELNPDSHNPKYNTKYGMYEPHCGLDNLKFAWGHDEYMYRMLVANGTNIPQEGLDMIRYHSAYPWHDKVSILLLSAYSIYLVTVQTHIVSTYLLVALCIFSHTTPGCLSTFDETRGL